MTAATVDRQPVALREVYRDRVLGLLRTDPRTVIVDSDTGLFKDIPAGLSDRYLNVGIAEQNLMGVAAGLCRDGFRPWVSTFATFAASRALESVKLDIAYPGLPVRIVATHAGLSAGHLGPTHHSLEDVGILRMLPNLTVVAPADAAQTEAVMDQAVDLPGPLYLRLGRKAVPSIAAQQPLRLGRVQPVQGDAGAPVAVLATGAQALAAAVAAADELAGEGIGVRVINLHTVKPLDTAGLRPVLFGARLCVTIEEHWRTGGIGSALAEMAVDLDGEPHRARLIRLGVPDHFVSQAGDEKYLLGVNGVDAAALVSHIRAWAAG